MQLGLNLINEERILELVKELKQEEESEDLSSADAEKTEEPDSAGRDGKKDELELLIMQLEEMQEERKENILKKDGTQKGADKEEKKNSTLKSIIKEIDKKFGAKSKKGKEKANKIRDYLKSELFNQSQYGTSIQDLFNYLKTRSATDVYKAFYSNGKDRINNFEDEPLGYAKMVKIQQMAKLARYMGWMGETEYCSHEMLDADTKEKWHLIRNITHVFILSLLRYETVLQ